MESLEDPHRVAATAAAGIVGDIGEDQRGRGGSSVAFASRIASSSEVSVARNRSRRAQPASAISRASALRRLGIGRGDHDGKAIERRVGVGEAAHHRDVQHATGIGWLAHALLAEIDHLAVRPLVRVLAGQHADGRRHDRQADAREIGRACPTAAGAAPAPIRRPARACRDAGWCGSRCRRSPARHWPPTTLACRS